MNSKLLCHFSLAHTECNMLENHFSVSFSVPLQFFPMLILNLTINFYKLQLLGNLTFKKHTRIRLSPENKEMN